MSHRPFAISLEVGSSLANHTGAWRSERPVYVRRTPPCNNACPAGEDVQAWLYEAESGEGGYERAWRRLIATNPFPAIMGRVCFHPCESACNRAQLDEAVGINAVERFLGDRALQCGWQLPAPPAATGRRVLIVGAGPAGLSAAYQLALRGHHVTVREQAGRAGGMMRYGIPAYRLPRAVLDAEVQRLLALGIELRLGERIGDLQATMRDGAFDAVFLAVGAHVARHTEIPGGSVARVIDAVSMLHDIEEGGAPQLGRHVAVYGGGDTAIDAARSVMRLQPRPAGAHPGAQEAPSGALPAAQEPIVIYRRTPERMPAHREELDQAIEEDISFRWLSTIAGFDPDGQKLRIERMSLDAEGMPQPTGEIDELGADTVILALGQDADLRLLATIDGIVIEDRAVVVDEQLMTGRRGVFAGGDMVPAERNVAVAVGHGAHAARCIDAYLRGQPAADESRAPEAAFEHLNTWYYGEAPQQVRARLQSVRRQSGFEEVVLGLAEDSALLEARRCLSCGNCFECDNCFGVCPDDAVLKPGTEGSPYAIDLDYCKGCGICVRECPCGAIEMVPEQI